MRVILCFVGLSLFLAFAAETSADENSRNTSLTVTTRPEFVQAVMHVKPDEAVVAVALARTLPPALTPRDHERLQSVTRGLKRGRVDQAERHWSGLMRAVSGSATPIDVSALVQWVLREAYVETNKDLRFYADKVRFYNDQKEAVRDHLNATREALAGMQRNSKVRIRKMAVASSYKKKEPVRVHGERTVSAAELAEEIEKWEQQLASIGDDAQLANMDLQNALQKQQQTLQTMSNVSKMLHDTAMAVIRKIG